MTAGPQRAGLPAPRVWAAVAVGGAAGSEARYLLGLAFPQPAAGVDLVVLWVNVAASLALGWLTGRWSARPAPDWVRAGLGPGLLGGFSTFSALALSLERLTAAGSAAEAAGYLAASLLLGLGAAALGLFLGLRRGRNRGAGAGA